MATEKIGIYAQEITERYAVLKTRSFLRMNYLFFDTETTGVPKRYGAPIEDVENWPRLVQLGWMVYDEQGQKLSENEFIVFPDGFEISEEVSLIHGITQQRAIEEGWPLQFVLGAFLEDLQGASVIVGHNLEYDVSIIGAEFIRMGGVNLLSAKSQICTMKASTDFCQIPGKRGFKWPKLHELYYKLFGEDMGAAHTALQDIQNTAKCYFELKRLGVIE